MLYEVAELMCVKCLNRWIGVYPLEWPIKNIICNKCDEDGHVIKTGQVLPKVVLKKFENDEHFKIINLNTRYSR